MTALILDPSIQVTGYAIYRGAMLLDSGVVRTRTKRTDQDDVSRIGYLVHELRILAAPHGIRETVIEIPGAFSYQTTAGGKGLNQEALRKLNMVIGAFICMAAGWPTYLVSVQTWKGQRAKALDRLAAPDAETDDESDAIALGRWFVVLGRHILDDAMKDTTAPPRRRRR